MTKIGILAATAVLSVCGLSGCGGSEEDFCTAYLSLEDTGDLTTDEAFDVVDDLGNNAPDEIEADVEVLVDAFDTVKAVVEDTDVDMDVPESELSEEDARVVDEAFTEADIDEDKVGEAFASIGTWTEENCTAA